MNLCKIHVKVVQVYFTIQFQLILFLSQKGTEGIYQQPPPSKAAGLEGAVGARLVCPST